MTPTTPTGTAADVRDLGQPDHRAGRPGGLGKRSSRGCGFPSDHPHQVPGQDERRLLLLQAYSARTLSIPAANSLLPTPTATYPISRRRSSSSLYLSFAWLADERLLRVQVAEVERRRPASPSPGGS